MLRRSVPLLATVGLVLLGACGGSGGGNGGQPVPVVLGNNAFAGTYFALLLTGGLTSSGPAMRATTGTLTADGAGHASHTQVANDSGDVSAPSTFLYDFAVAPDGTLALSSGALVFARGGIAADGRMALLSSTFPGGFPGVFVLLRREGFHEITSLSGDYRVAEYVFAPLSGDSAALVGDGTFDGAGVATLTVGANAMGTVLAGRSFPIEYSVIGDGTSSVVFDVSGLAGPPVIEGGVGAGGDVAVWAGSTTDMQSPNLLVALRAPASAGPGTLQGAYWAVLLERDPGSDEFRSLYGTVTADGVGGITLAATSNTEGVLAVEPPQSTTYSVSPGGKLSVDAGGNLLAGGITGDGRYAALGGGLAAGSNPTIVLLCRK